MANEEHLNNLTRGTSAWNSLRRAQSHFVPDLHEADLSEADFSGANLTKANFTMADLSGANLSGASFTMGNLSGANLTEANFTMADFSGADLIKANLSRANLTDANLLEARLIGATLDRANLSRSNLIGATLDRANLSGANLIGAKLDRANLSGANLSGADFSGAKLHESLFNNVDLSTAIGLESCHHTAPSGVDYRTLTRSKNVPLVFWRGCGLPDALIEYMPSLTGDAIQFYSCFISYSSKDQKFAERLHADLQDNGVRCWFAPHDLPIGAKTWDGIDEAIRSRDKVLLILSKRAIDSNWVEDEVTMALSEERRRKKLVLFPVRLDPTVMKTDEPWARKLRDNRNIGDFSKWKNHDAYKATFDRVLRDLKQL